MAFPSSLLNPCPNSCLNLDFDRFISFPNRNSMQEATLTGVDAVLKLVQVELSGRPLELRLGVENYNSNSNFGTNFGTNFGNFRPKLRDELREKLREFQAKTSGQTSGNSG